MIAGVRALAPGVFVAGQIDPRDLAELFALGVRTVVGNRPDDEEPGQPSAAVMAQAAHAAGLAFVHAPAWGLPDDDAVEQVRQALEGEGDVLLYCKSGLRSAAAWAMAVTRSGRMTRDTAVAAGAQAGFDLSRLPF